LLSSSAATTRRTLESIYPNDDELIEDIAAAYRQVIRQLYDAGCRNIQFDDCTWGMIIDKDYWGSYGRQRLHAGG
jgi:methionine synthase II (cobalamin-independent)